jgi:hypothetical protein
MRIHPRRRRKPPTMSATPPTPTSPFCGQLADTWAMDTDSDTEESQAPSPDANTSPAVCTSSRMLATHYGMRLANQHSTDRRASTPGTLPEYLTYLPATLYCKVLETTDYDIPVGGSILSFLHPDAPHTANPRKEPPAAGPNHRGWDYSCSVIREIAHFSDGPIIVPVTATPMYHLSKTTKNPPFTFTGATDPATGVHHLYAHLSNIPQAFYFMWLQDLLEQNFLHIDTYQSTVTAICSPRWKWHQDTTFLTDPVLSRENPFYWKGYRVAGSTHKTRADCILFFVLWNYLVHNPSYWILLRSIRTSHFYFAATPHTRHGCPVRASDATTTAPHDATTAAGHFSYMYYMLALTIIRQIDPRKHCRTPRYNNVPATYTSLDRFEKEIFLPRIIIRWEAQKMKMNHRYCGVDSLTRSRPDFPHPHLSQMEWEAVTDAWLLQNNRPSPHTMTEDGLMPWESPASLEAKLHQDLPECYKRLQNAPSFYLTSA